jgi:hypothetical protein
VDRDLDNRKPAQNVDIYRTIGYTTADFEKAAGF